MITTKSLTREIGELRGLGELAQTYEFIAASSMRRIRNSVLENRTFHLGLNRIFEEVKRAYDADIRLLAPSKRSTRLLSFRDRPRKSATVFLSANTSLYGEIIAKTFSLFIEDVKKGESDVVIVGRLGRTLFEEEMHGGKHIYFDFPDGSVPVENLKAISTYLNQYQTVTVFHGSFKSLVIQEAMKTSVSGENISGEASLPQDKERKYLFEPSLETIILFFETEIFGSLLEQVFHESRLAKLASRMVLLDRASVNVEGALKRVTLKRQQIQHRVFNRKQLDLMSGVGLWIGQ